MAGPPALVTVDVSAIVIVAHRRCGCHGRRHVTGVAMTVAVAMAMVVTKANVSMAMVEEVQVTGGAEAAMAVVVVVTIRRLRDLSPSMSDAICRDRGTNLPP